jgi:hypothetical protein
MLTGCLVTQPVVKTLIVIINLDVFENLPTRFALGDEELIGRKTLRFERTEKFLHLGIVVTISPATHAQLSSDYG